MVKKIGIILLLVLAVPTGTAFADLYQQDGKPCPPECVSDSLEIVTWYPSPYNEYEELRLYPVQRDDSYCTDDKKGLMYYDDNNTPMDASDDKVRVCMGSSTWTGGGWQSAGHWEYVSGTTDIKPSNSGVVKIQNLKIDQTTQDGYVLTSDVNGNASWKTVSSGGHGQQFLSSSGTFTVPQGITTVIVTAMGGGGGGGNGGGAGTGCCGGGGGGGGGGGSGRIAVSIPVAVTSQTTYFVTVGAGGARGANGGDSGFGSLLMIAGGMAGQRGGVGGVQRGGDGGIGSVNGVNGGAGGDNPQWGGSGGAGGALNNASGGGGGQGGKVLNGSDGYDGIGYGAGGGGGGGGCLCNGISGPAGNEGLGGKGQSGYVLVQW